ncbi:MAG: tRNA (guanosine(46)-N7)-methyltransferase TrmB [Balneolales bacterium]|nr:tRNA (guanosine(46)-N7)-methyltransferase TrmB [Balneolales bacterium]
MGKQKLRRYSEITEFENVHDLSTLRPGDTALRAGKWAMECFGNSRPIIIELACGKGDYALALAARFKEYNFIGVDKKGDRLWKGAVAAKEQGLDNVAFIRGSIKHLSQIFGPQEISEIWITFPDPYLKNRRRSRRLTAPGFLEIYARILKPDSLVHLKTDSPELFEFTTAVIEREKLDIKDIISDVYALNPIPELLAIQTYYEKMHLEENRTIRYVSFRLPVGFKAKLKL